MKLQIIQAPNMKKAMMRIQDEMGPDALIYRTRSCQDGIEVLAGMPSDINEAVLADATFEEVQQAQPDQLVSSQLLETKLNSIDQTMRALTDKIERFELNNGLLDTRATIAIKYQNYFKQLGFSETVITALFQKFIDKQTSVEFLATNVQHEIFKHIKKYDIDIINKKIITAIVGPTGVGKTTTVIKLATRFLESNHRSKIGIISTDIEDLTIKNKLSHYCHLFQVDFEFVNSPEELHHVLNKMADKDLVLIDTHGVNQRDHESVHHLINMFEKPANQISVYLALPCNQQEEVLHQIIKTFAFNKVAGCILTKTDESIKITPALGMVMLHKLPIAYLCNGQNIDHDIALPSTKLLADSLPIIFCNDDAPVLAKRKSFQWMRPFAFLGFPYFKTR